MPSFWAVHRGGVGQVDLAAVVILADQPQPGRGAHAQFDGSRLDRDLLGRLGRLDFQADRGRQLPPKELDRRFARGSGHRAGAVTIQAHDARVGGDRGDVVGHVLLLKEALFQNPKRNPAARRPRPGPGSGDQPSPGQCPIPARGK